MWSEVLEKYGPNAQVPATKSKMDEIEERFNNRCDEIIAEFKKRLFIMSSCAIFVFAFYFIVIFNEVMR